MEPSEIVNAFIEARAAAAANADAERKRNEAGAIAGLQRKMQAAGVSLDGWEYTYKDHEPKATRGNVYIYGDNPWVFYDGCNCTATAGAVALALYCDRMADDDCDAAWHDYCIKHD